MVQSIGLRNFKCFRELELKLAPITLLAGLNGMGKSSAVQAILLIYQSFESGDLPAGQLLLGGDLVDLGSGVDILFEDANDDVVEIDLAFNSLGLDRQTFRFAYDRESDRLQSVSKSEGARTKSPFGGGLSYLGAGLGPRKMLPLSESRARKGDLGVRGEYVLHLLIEQGGKQLREGDPRLRDAPSTRLADQVDAWLQEISPVRI